MHNIHKTKLQQISKFKSVETKDQLEKQMLRAYYDTDLKEIRSRSKFLDMKAKEKYHLLTY